MKLFDTRWNGPHGIGRFSAEVRRRISGFESLAMRGKPSNPMDPIALAAHLYRAAPAFFFSPGYNAPLRAPCPFAFCVHDLNHLFIRENSSGLKRAYYRYFLRPAIHRAVAVLTVSEFSRESICTWANVDARKVINVGNGVSAVFSPTGPAVAGRVRPFFLCVSSDRPHKNLQRQLAAFAASKLSEQFDLLITARPAEETLAIVRQLKIDDAVSFIGNVPDDKLAELYRSASALLFVSLFEGFGLPIVEAMASGTPVITSSVASMPEIAGDAAVLVDPTDIGAIGDAMRSLATDAALRQTLRERGLERARHFSWDLTARRISAALESCA